MRLIPYSFNSFKLNDNNYTLSKFTDPHNWSLSQTDINLIPRGGAFPAFGAVQYNAKTFAIEIFLKKCQDTYSENLKTGLNTSPAMNQGLKELIAIDSASGKRVSIMAFCTNLTVNDEYGKSWTATFVAPDPEWKGKTTLSATKTYTASGQTLSVTYHGNVPTRPVVLITCNTARTAGYPYYRYVTLGNTFANGGKNYPYDITDGGINTSTLVGAGKVRSDGYDLRVYDNGVMIDRWLSGMNGTNTKIWCILSFTPPKTTLKLSGSIAGSGTVTTITLKKAYSGSGKSRVFYLDGMPKTGVIKIDSEQFYYSSLDIKNGIITVSQRAARGTSMGAHTDNTTIDWIEHDLKIIYGNSTESIDQQVNSEMQPIFNLSSSTNTSWVYDTNFGSTSGTRPGSFKPIITRRTGDQTTMYTATQLDQADPFTVMGMSIQAYILSNRWHSADATLSWNITHPAGITTVTSSGYIYRVSSSWPNVCNLQKLKGTSWVNQFNLATPGSALSWTSWTKNSEALGATYQQIRFVLSGSIGAYADNQANFQVGSVTLTLDNTKTPTVSLSSEITTGYNTDMNINVASTFDGSAVSDSMYVKTPIDLSEQMRIDTDLRTATRGSGLVNILPGISLDKARSFWLVLYPGVNVITLTESGLQNVTMVLQYQEVFN